MDKIYLLYGKVMHEFQKLEDYLYLLIYCTYKKSFKKFTKEKFLKLLENAEKNTLGGKIKELNQLKIFEAKNDIIVLNFLKNNRNHLAHYFFIENELKTEQEQLTKETELYTMLSHTALINKALTKMIIEQNKLSK